MEIVLLATWAFFTGMIYSTSRREFWHPIWSWLSASSFGSSGSDHGCCERRPWQKLVQKLPSTHGTGMTALPMALPQGHVSMVQLLIEREADPAIRDDLHPGDTEGAANHFGQIAVRDHSHPSRSNDAECQQGERDMSRSLQVGFSRT
jgi:hypothetical protein